MPKTEAELWDWVVEYNRLTTHNRGLSSNYGYQAILDTNLVEVCSNLKSEFKTPIRILDIGCGSGLALKQLSESHYVDSNYDGPQTHEIGCCDP